MKPRDGPEIRAGEKRCDIFPGEFAGSLQVLQLSPAIDDSEIGSTPQGGLHHRVVLLVLQRAGGINEAAAGSELSERRPQDCDLARLEIG